jgi:hypothetical protein
MFIFCVSEHTAMPKTKIKLVSAHAMMARGGVDIQLNSNQLTLNLGLRWR